MFGHAANRLQAVSCAGDAAWAARRHNHYFQRGRATDETRVRSLEHASRAHPLRREHAPTDTVYHTDHMPYYLTLYRLIQAEN